VGGNKIVGELEITKTYRAVEIALMIWRRATKVVRSPK